MRRKITPETWEQMETAYPAGINLRELARKMKIPEGTVLAHAKRHGWTQQVQVATRHLSVMRFFSTPPATATRPTVLVRSLATPRAATIRDNGVNALVNNTTAATISRSATVPAPLS